MTALTGRVRALVLVLVAALAFSIAPAAAAHASGPGSATFTITLGGEPLGSTQVIISGPDFQSGSSDETGQVSFSDLAVGDYTLYIGTTVAHQGATVPFSLTDEAPQWQQQIVLVPWPTGDGSISGTVVGLASGSPVAGAWVQVTRADAPGPFAEVTTDSAGQFEVTDLVDGLYNVGVVYASGYFSTWTQVEITAGEAEHVVLAVLEADSTITGRVVDSTGAGVAGLWVSATLINSSGGTAATTDADGYYTLTGAGAGTWELSIAADSQWERAVITVEIAAASTVTAPDLVLVPRFTGTLSGLVASSDGIPESQQGGFFDVRATVLEADGTPVPGASLVTGGDSFYYFWLAPGDYTVYFEDVDSDRAPHLYSPVYLGGATTLSEATIVTVETGADTWLDTTVLSPDLGDPEPDHEATPAAKKKLTKAKEDRIAAPDKARRGTTVTVSVGTEFAGTWVSAWIYSAPQQLGGWHQVAADGTIEVPIPATAPLGSHRLSVQNADDVVIGWTKVQIKK
jgi:hypothetical protein